MRGVRWCKKLHWGSHENHVPQKSGSPMYFFLKNTFFLGGHAGVIRYRTSEVTKHIPQCTSTSVFLVYFLGILRFWLDIWYHQRTKAWLSNQSALRKSNRKINKKTVFLMSGVMGGVRWWKIWSFGSETRFPQMPCFGKEMAYFKGKT